MITNKVSFDHIEDWNNEILRFAPDGVCTMLIGNKLDLIKTKNANRYVSVEESKNLCKRLLIPNCIETSAKTAKNVDEAFELIAQQMLNAKKRADFPFYG